MKLQLLENKNGFLLHRDSVDGKYYISKETNKPKDTKIVRDSFTLYSHGVLEGNDKAYEVLSIEENQFESLINSLFILISQNETKSIEEQISEIESFFANSDFLTIQDVRGVFAEIYSLLGNDHLKINRENAIFDFEENGQDVEIKSFSPSKKIITISLQQVRNSENVKVICHEVFETANGESVRSIYNRLPNKSKRYSWINASKSQLLDEKFAVGKTIYFSPSEIFESINFDDKIVNANFEIFVGNEK